jgi:hypothetical protein
LSWWGPLIDLALERPVELLQLRRHAVELLAERLELVAGRDVDPLIERSGTDPGGALLQRADRRHHPAGQHQARQHRERQAGEQDEAGGP